MQNTIDNVCKTIEKYKLLNKGDNVLVALSGGADSVCLLTLLCELKDVYNLRIYAAHLNHMLRGKDADSDEEFARGLCDKLGVTFFSKKVNVLEYAQNNGQTTEEAGRNLRYNFFEEISKEHFIDKIATAHNKDDNAETLVMRFIRGTSVLGLSGIPHKNRNIIRPVLDLSRFEIEEFLKEKGFNFVTDKSNKEPVYFRNKVRLCLIPEIEKNYNPRFKETLSNNILNYKDAADFLKASIDNTIKNIVKFEKNYAYIKICDFTKQHNYIKTAVIHNLLEKMSADKQVVSERVSDILLVAENGKGTVDFSKSLYVTAIYNKLFFVKKKDSTEYQYKITVPSKILIKETGDTISFEFVEKKEKSKKAVYINYDECLNKKLIIRNRKDGDVFHPSGLNGKKKLKDYFIDEKIPFFVRDDVPLVVSGDEIVSVGNLRVSEKYKVNNETKNILKIELS